MTHIVEKVYSYSSDVHCLVFFGGTYESLIGVS